MFGDRLRERGKIEALDLSSRDLVELSRCRDWRTWKYMRGSIA